MKGLKTGGIVRANEQVNGLQLQRYIFQAFKVFDVYLTKHCEKGCVCSLQMQYYKYHPKNR